MEIPIMVNKLDFLKVCVCVCVCVCGGGGGGGGGVFLPRPW